MAWPQWWRGEIKAVIRVRVQRTGLLLGETSTKPKDEVSKFCGQISHGMMPLGALQLGKKFWHHPKRDLGHHPDLPLRFSSTGI
jgi:hypothetical protein